MTLYSYCAYCGARNDQAHYKGCYTLASTLEKAVMRDHADHEAQLQAVQTALTAAEIWFDIFVEKERARTKMLANALMVAQGAIATIPRAQRNFLMDEALEMADAALAAVEWPTRSSTATSC